MRSAPERAALLLGALYAALALHQLGAADIVGDDEAREVGLVQEIAAGHWLWPRFNDEILPDKPILFHWLAAVPVAVAGFSEAAVRLPAALAGAALVGSTAVLGAELIGATPALVAAAMVATTPALFTHARVARPDTLLVLLLTVALGLAFRWWRDGRARHATAALALLGLATFAKGPVAPALFALTLGLFLAWQGDLRRLWRLFTIPGVLAFLAIGLGWYVVALAGWGELFVHEHLLGRYVRNLAGGLATGGSYSPRPLSFHLLFYAKHLPAVALPWTPLVAVTLWQAGRSDGFRDPRLRFLLCWAIAPVLVFTPAEWKLRYYLLPSIPPLALMAAPAAWRLIRRPPHRLGARSLAVLAGVVAIAVGFGLWAADGSLERLSVSDRTQMGALVSLVPGRLSGVVAAVGFFAGIVMVAIAWRAWSALVVATALVSLAWLLFGVPALEQAVADRDSLKQFARDVGARFPAPAALGFDRDLVRPVVVYAGRHIPTLRRRDARAGGLALIATEDGYRELVQAGVAGPPLLLGAGRLKNSGRGRLVLFEAYKSAM